MADVIFVPARGGYFNIDLAAMQTGRARNGFLYEGEPITPGFDGIVQPGECLSVLIVLDDGQVGMGEGVSVILAGAAGREAIFRPADHVAWLEEHVRPLLIGRSLENGRELAEEMDALRVDGDLLHGAARYAITQAIFHASALARRRTVAQVIAEDYGIGGEMRAIPILAACEQGDMALTDRIILKRADLLPHGSFASVENDLGTDGGKLLDYARGLAARIGEVGGEGYRPTIHFDCYGSIGSLYPDPAEAAAYLDRVAEAVAPYPLLIESPIIMPSREEQFASYRALRVALRDRGSTVRIIIDEWCNTLDDIRECARMGATDFVQIKTPDLGGINNSIEAVLICRAASMGACLGGSANETDISARMTVQVALACQPDFLMSKPGLGFDEAYMIMSNEMSRTLALAKRRA
ncbi:MAG: methylaspartate ammonia-lyase [Sphingobium sp.]